MRKSNVEIIVDNEKYVWTSTGYDITIWKDSYIFYKSGNYGRQSFTNEIIKEMIININKDE